MRLYCAGLLAFTAAPTARSPWYGFFTWYGFLIAFRYLAGAWRWTACAVVSFIFGVDQGGGFHRLTASQAVIWVVLACVDVVLVGLFVLLGAKSEEQNLGLIARGHSNREAAAALFISEATVKTHVLHIYAKLGVNDRAAAVAAGFERGLLPRP